MGGRRVANRVARAAQPKLTSLPNHSCFICLDTMMRGPVHEESRDWNEMPDLRHHPPRTS